MKIKISIVFLLSIITLSYGRPFKIISNNGKGQTTTDTIKSGEFILGINDFGGGTISMVSIPGIGNIMGKEALSYGRMGQSSIRDGAHSGKYNPTQAGTNEELGTECEVTKTTGKMVVEPRGCALWRADNSYDFMEWENIGNDNYNETIKHRGTLNSSDEDGLDESKLAVKINGKSYTKQEAEVYSEFDYYGTYENAMGKNGIAIPAFRHYLEYRFIRPAGHCINQFRAGSKMWDATKVVADISVQQPVGIHKGTDKDMNNLSQSWSIRNDLALWYPKFRHIQTVDGKWMVEERTVKANNRIDTKFKQVFIIADSIDENSGKAMGFYRPNTDINTFQIVGVKESDNSIAYKDNRIKEAFYIEMPTRTPKMSWMGFRNSSLGLIERSHLPKGIYETYREETYIFYGTPKQIKDAIIAFEKTNKMK